MSETYVLESKTGEWKIIRVQGVMGLLQKTLGRSPAGIYAKSASSETARISWDHPKDIPFVVIIAGFFVTAFAAFFSGLAAIGALIGSLILAVSSYSIIRIKIRTWLFREGNPTPIPRFDDLMRENSDPKPILDRTLDGTVEHIDRIVNASNVRDLTQPPANLMMYMILIALGVLIGYVLATALAR